MLCGPRSSIAALADVENRCQGCQSGDVVHHDAAGKVEHAPALQNSPAPNHVHEGEVNEGEPSRQKQAVGLEAHAIGEGARNERRGDDGEHHLVSNEDHHGDGVVRGRSCEIDAVQAGVMEIADDAVPVPAEAQRISVQIPDDGGPAHRDKALDHDGEDVLASYQAAVEESEAWGHQHDEAGAQNHKTGITGVEVKHESLQEMKCGRSSARSLRQEQGPMDALAR